MGRKNRKLLIENKLIIDLLIKNYLCIYNSLIINYLLIND